MDALLASYGSDSDSDKQHPRSACIGNGECSSRDTRRVPEQEERSQLPPPPDSLLDFANPQDCQVSKVDRIRCFPHVQGNYALHVFIPVIIPSSSSKSVATFLKNMATYVPGLCAIDIDISLSDLCTEEKLEQTILGKEFHISLGRTVPIRVHQIDSIVSLLRQKVQLQKRYLIEFNKWEVFVNDDETRSFLSLEVTKEGLSEISKQIQIVDTVYRLHGLPEFYKNPRPHISLAWAFGDISHVLEHAVKGLVKHSCNLGHSPRNIFACQFSGVKCRIGKKSYTIC